MKSKTDSTTKKGKKAEDYACLFLQKENYTILERNFNTRFGEIDIVAEKNKVLYFFEVKSGIGFEPIYNITPNKLQKLSKTIEIYLKEHRLNLPYCISALILSKNTQSEDFNVHLVENITLF